MTEPYVVDPAAALAEHALSAVELHASLAGRLRGEVLTLRALVLEAADALDRGDPEFGARDPRASALARRLRAAAEVCRG